MKFKIIYTERPHGGHMFAMPEEIHSEIVNTLNWKTLDKYIASKKDNYGQFYKKSIKPFPLGHRFTTNNGGVKVGIYIPPTIKKV